MLLINFVTLMFLVQCEAQNNIMENNNRIVGDPCEGCEAIYEYGSKNFQPVDTLPAFFEESEKLKITGTVYKKDGRTPAEGVILYAYHTNANGIYPKRGDETGWAIRHGYYRGWIKTGKDGKYTFYTSKPGIYPSRSDAAHIHFLVKEPDKNEYYISDINFDDDPLLTARERNNPHQKGGPGIIRLKKENGMWVAERNITLGLNITNYE